MSDSPNHRVFCYRIDPQGLITYANNHWFDFAVENNCHYLTQERVINSNLWGYISNDETRHLYQLLVKKVLKEGESIVLPFRCDSPEIRRFMQMRISQADSSQCEFQCRIVKEEYRDPVDILDPSTARCEDYLRMCSWCKKVDAGNERWVEVEKAILELDLFAEQYPPEITHTICPDCMEIVEEKLA